MFKLNQRCRGYPRNYIIEFPPFSQLTNSWLLATTVASGVLSAPYETHGSREHREEHACVWGDVRETTRGHAVKNEQQNQTPPNKCQRSLRLPGMSDKVQHGYPIYHVVENCGGLFLMKGMHLCQHYKKIQCRK